MARLPRICPIGIPQHIIQRGNNRQHCFASEQDYGIYLKWLKEYADTFEVSVHSWVLMTNHVHLLCTPHNDDAISNMMQALGRRYVRYFNCTHQRTGTLWEGRFKSCLVEQSHYLLNLYKYIEMNPVRANMVSHPAEYNWSSYRVNGLGMESDLCSKHALYVDLGANREERLFHYRILFEKELNQEHLECIKQSTLSGLAIGSDNFKHEMECLTGRRVRPGKIGRPKSVI